MNRKNKLVTIVSNEEGQQHCWINQNAKLSLGWFEKGVDADYQLNPVNKGIYVFVMNGLVAVNGIGLGKRDAVGIWDASAISIHAKEESEYIIIEAPINH